MFIFIYLIGMEYGWMCMVDKDRIILFKSNWIIILFPDWPSIAISFHQDPQTNWLWSGYSAAVAVVQILYTVVVSSPLILSAPRAHYVCRWAQLAVHNLWIILYSNHCPQHELNVRVDFCVLDTIGQSGWLGHVPLSMYNNLRRTLRPLLFIQIQQMIL